MAVSNELLEYQNVDAKLLEIERELAGSDERKKFVQAKKFIEAAAEKLEAQDRRAEGLLSARDALSARCEEMAKAISEYSELDDMAEDDGAIAFYKRSAQSLMEQLRAIKGEIAKLTADIQAAVDDYKKLKEQTIAMQKQGKEYQEKYTKLKGERAAEVKAIAARLNKLAENIPADILEKYQTKRKERIFPILVALKADNRCACGMELSLAEQGKLSGGKVIECEHCRRFIYKS